MYRRIIFLVLCILLISSVVAQADPGLVDVSGYFRSNGTWVAPYIRTAPDGIPWNNFSYHGTQFATAPAASSPYMSAGEMAAFAGRLGLILLGLALLAGIALIVIAYKLLQIPFNVVLEKYIDKPAGKIAACFQGIYLSVIIICSLALIFCGTQIIGGIWGHIIEPTQSKVLAYLLLYPFYPFLQMPSWIIMPLLIAAILRFLVLLHKLGKKSSHGTGFEATYRINQTFLLLDAVLLAGAYHIAG